LIFKGSIRAVLYYLANLRRRPGHRLERLLQWLSVNAVNYKMRIPDLADATSNHQDSLPVSSDAVMALLEQWGIEYQRFDHVALRTVAELKQVQYQFLSS
jgi:hypothetical protein